MAAVLLSQTYWLGCSGKNGNGPTGGDDSNGDSEFKPETVIVGGTVDLEEIGGEGLEVISAWDSSAVAPETGTFEIEISDSAAQFHLVADKDGNARAGAISIPSENGRKNNGLIFDGTSTALALLMLTPGLIAVHTDSAEIRLDEFRNLITFPRLDSLITERIALEPLSAVVQHPLVVEALDACLYEWRIRAENGEYDKAGKQTSETDFFDVSMHDASNPAAVLFGLINRAPRFVNVYRRAMFSGGGFSPVEPVFTGGNAMEGVRMRDLLRNPDEAMSVKYNQADLHCGTDIAQVEYWITGLGKGDIIDQMPASPDLDYSGDFEIAAAKTFLYYIARPVLSIIFGAVLQHPIIEDTVLETITHGLTSLQNATSPAEVREALQQLAMAVIYSALLAILQLVTPIFGLAGMLWSLMTSFWSWVDIFGFYQYYYLAPAISVNSIDNPISQSNCVPVVVATYPSNGEIYVPPETEIRATFSHEMDPASISDNTFMLSGGITGDVVYNIEAKTAIFTPHDDLEYYTKCTVTITTDVYSTDSLHMAEDFQWSFTTAGETPPWTITYIFESIFEKSVNCATGSSCNCWDCPDTSNMPCFFLAGDTISFIDIPVRVDSGSISHNSDGWQLAKNLGSFSVEEASVGVTGSYSADQYDVTLTFSGTAIYWPCALFDRPGPFKIVFTMNDGIRNGTTISGDFTLEANITTPDTNCAYFSYIERGSGNCTVHIGYGSNLPLAAGVDNDKCLRIIRKKAESIFY
jgi:hypothetical protein